MKRLSSFPSSPVSLSLDPSSSSSSSLVRVKRRRTTTGVGCSDPITDLSSSSSTTSLLPPLNDVSPSTSSIHLCSSLKTYYSPTPEHHHDGMGTTINGIPPGVVIPSKESQPPPPPRSEEEMKKLIQRRQWQQKTPLLFDLSKKKRENPGSIVKELKRLHKLLDSKSSNEENQKIKKSLILKDNAPATILRIMDQWKNHREVLSSCCACLSRLAYQCSVGGCTIANSNGIVAIARAMNTFPNSLHIQRFGCAALSNVLADHSADAQIQQALHQFVEEQDGLDLITQAMSSFKDDATLQARCCGLLSKVATRRDFHEALQNACVKSAIGNAIEHHWDNDKVQKQAAGFIQMLD